VNKFVAAFDRWIRSSFVEINTALEERYFAQEDRAATGNVDDPIKQTLVEEGRVYIIDLLQKGNTDEGFDQAFDLLGNVGLYRTVPRANPFPETLFPGHSRTPGIESV